MEPTNETYTAFDQAFIHFNQELFGGKLPACMMTLQRRNKMYGYFWGETWKRRRGKKFRDEIALNPDHFRRRSVQEVLSTLVHEQVHQWQHHFGKPSRNGYHNEEWAIKMETVGLIPSSTGAPGGKRTGQGVSHYITKGGPFDETCQALLADGFKLTWLAQTGDEKTRRKKAASKTKYTCPDCNLNAWAKPETSLICGECSVELKAESVAGVRP